MKIAINGFGRIGRNVFKIAMEREGVDVIGINDLTDAKTLAHLLKYDSTYGVYTREVTAGQNKIIVDGIEIPVYAEKNPSSLPWDELGVDVAIESTGVFRSSESEKGGYLDHIKAGASKVILTVPAKDEIETVVLGVNEEKIVSQVNAYSNASCTTNCLAPVVKVLNDAFGIEKGLMTTIHSYTNDQVILDMPHSDLRRARSAGLNIIPTSTGAALAIAKVIPELDGKLNGGSMRVPTPTGSLVDLTVQLVNDCTVEELNKAMKSAAEGDLKGILEYTEDPIVSMDVKGNPHSSIFDAGCTMKMGEGFFKVISWYDNEMGYSTRVVDLAQKLA
ncbi:type I glyceraldehyde-3-phosphate dehydrogenase [Oceanispirochaeta crateris]|uniref:Glyceraldehyde-3-phosphate dehydrogenase n=1 Tax=Oceanispirochaeta crateris TaxID=2518645 RepID=A0A5C1QNF1_9SPIO|nr:type I glyceraldehyde-3-phosphate dehydrogenase [Oceanispirochaeta crateris]QEN07702.1 type I glyceraldehyde-3-phosphate dehydrogenase [Oceanispirochaeta crateris]